MNQIYIGDRPLDPPDDSWQCPHCQTQLGSLPALYAHIRQCPVAQAKKEPEEE